MIAVDLIVHDVSPLCHTDSGQKALLWMDDLKVWHCPVLKEKNFVGLLTENDLLDKTDLSLSLDELFTHLPRPFVWENDHLYDVMAKMGASKLSVLPVLDRNENYIGLTTVHYLMFQISLFGAVQEPGGVIVLEMNQNDYSMSQVAQIVESNQAKIISSQLVFLPNSTKIELVLKLNTFDVERIVRTFIRYDYYVKSTHQKSDLSDDYQHRFDALMAFMNV